MRKPWTEKEMVLTLAFYLFEENVTSRKKIKDFSNKLYGVTKIKRSPSSIGLRIGNYQFVDPNYLGKGLNGGGKKSSIHLG